MTIMIKLLFSAIKQSLFSLKFSFFLGGGVGYQKYLYMYTGICSCLMLHIKQKISTSKHHSSLIDGSWLKLTASESKDGSEMKTCKLSAIRTIYNTYRIWTHYEIPLTLASSVMKGVLIWATAGSLRRVI